MDRKRNVAALGAVGDCICIAVHQAPFGYSHNAAPLMPAEGLIMQVSDLLRQCC